MREPSSVRIALLTPPGGLDGLDGGSEGASLPAIEDQVHGCEVGVVDDGGILGGIGQAGIKLQRPRVRLQGAVVVEIRVEHRAEVVVRERVVRIEVDGLAETPLRLARLFDGEIGASEIGPDNGVLRVGVRGLPESGDGLLEVAGSKLAGALRRPPGGLARDRASSEPLRWSLFG